MIYLLDITESQPQSLIMRDVRDRVVGYIRWQHGKDVLLNTIPERGGASLSMSAISQILSRYNAIVAQRSKK